ncbi:MAG TPA: transposase [Desulfosporosinus sp.]|nr:tyrosine-type recombinase/integrase [Desulfosporosinus sp. BICA1-9]KJS81866.1 MAG: transposase [Desulfosporosinus sp. BICA1-9]HBW38812.1 transposase [Desulfosporosinus sp.]
MLLNNKGEFVEPVIKFLKFKDNSGSARETLRAYCHHLKLYFEFLEQKGLLYYDLGIDEMAEFMRWLQNPHANVKVFSISPRAPMRKPSTINTIMTAVEVFYDYLNRHVDYSIKLSDRLKRQMMGSRRGFKDFLYHINKDKLFNKKILKLKVAKSRPKTLPKKDIALMIEACTNFRDEFLLYLLWESGMRIGEALALWLEDFEIDGRRIHIRDRGELSNLAEIKTVCSPRTLDVSADLMNMYLDYITEFHMDEVDTNHVFIKMSGENRYQPLEYGDITSLFKRLCTKTGIQVHPHMFRHTHLDSLRRLGWAPELVQKRAGHANYQTTVQEYYHVTDEEVREAWEKTEARIRINKTKRGATQID